MKIFKYLLFPIPFFACFIIFCFVYSSINILSYLLLMLLPIIISSVQTGLVSKASRFKISSIKLSIINTVLYLVFFLAVVLFSNRYDIFNSISENSAFLFSEGFSIGNDFSISVGDTILPCLVCFIVNYFVISRISKDYERREQ